MHEATESLTARPADVVTIACGAYEEAWRSRGNSATLVAVISSQACDEAKTRLCEARRRETAKAIDLAWGVTWPILERLMKESGYLNGTIHAVLEEAERYLGQVTEAGGP